MRKIVGVNASSPLYKLVGLIMIVVAVMSLHTSSFSADFSECGHDNPQETQITPANATQLIPETSFDIGVMDAPLTLFIFQIALSSSGAYLAIQYEDGAAVETVQPFVQIWDVEQGKLLYELPQLTSPAQILFSPDERYFASASLGFVSLWNMNDGSLYREWSDASYFPAVTFSPDAQFFAFPDTDTEQVVLWNLQEDRLFTNQHTFTDGITKLFFNCTGDFLILGTSNGIYLIPSSQLGHDLPTPVYDSWFLDLQLSPRTKTLAVMAFENNSRFDLHLFNFSTNEFRSLEHARFSAFMRSRSIGSLLMYVDMEDESTLVLDLETGETFEGFQPQIGDNIIAINPNEMLIAAVTHNLGDNLLFGIYEIRTGNLLIVFPEESFFPLSSPNDLYGQFSSDGTFFLTVSPKSAVTLWSISID